MWETFQEISDTHSTARARSPSHGCSARITRGTRDARVELGPCAPATRRTGRPRDGERGFDVFLLFMHEVLRGRTPSHAVVPECARSYLRGFPTYDLAREGTTARCCVRPRALRYDRPPLRTTARNSGSAEPPGPLAGAPSLPLAPLSSCLCAGMGASWMQCMFYMSYMMNMPVTGRERQE